MIQIVQLAATSSVPFQLLMVDQSDFLIEYEMNHGIFMRCFITIDFSEIADPTLHRVHFY